MTFHSSKEAKRAQTLQYLQQAGQIGSLERQVDFPFHIQHFKEDAPDGEKTWVATYVADFTYVDLQKSVVVVEDVKSTATRKLEPYQIKKRLMKACYGVTIQEV